MLTESDFSRFVTQYINALNTARLDLTLEGGQVSSWVKAFTPNPGAASQAWEHILALVPAIITFLASFLIAFSGILPVLAPFIGVAIGVSQIFSLTAAVGSLTAEAAIQDFTVNQ